LRKAINENPVVQITIIVVLAAAVALILFIQLGGGGGGGGGGETPPPNVATLNAGQPGTTTAPPATGTDPSTAGAPTTPTGETGTVIEYQTEELVAGPGLPKDVVKAYENGKTILLVVADPDAIVDRGMIKEAKEVAKGDKGVVLFTVTPARISRYSRITIGVDANRSPLLIAVAPMNNTPAGAPPTAWARYGYRNTDGVRQLVADARYNGPTGTLSP